VAEREWDSKLTSSTNLGVRYLVLSPDEAARADRFHFERHRRRFIVARTAMRQILGDYCKVPAQEIVFAYGDRRKPALSGALEHSSVRFNLGHSEDVARLAVTNGSELWRF
jgi:4'-phosphopantetheinyl transferase